MGGKVNNKNPSLKEIEENFSRIKIAFPSLSQATKGFEILSKALEHPEIKKLFNDLKAIKEEREREEIMRTDPMNLMRFLPSRHDLAFPFQALGEFLVRIANLFLRN